jgi:hypothetical protein
LKPNQSPKPRRLALPLGDSAHTPAAALPLRDSAQRCSVPSRFRLRRSIASNYLVEERKTFDSF